MSSGCLVVRMRRANNEVLGSTPGRNEKSALFIHSPSLLVPSQISTNKDWLNPCLHEMQKMNRCCLLIDCGQLLNFVEYDT